MSDDLIARALAMYSHRGDGLATQYVNPDGPALVDALAAKDAEIARLKALLDEADRFANFVRVALNEGTWDDCIVMALQSYQRESAKLKGIDHASD